jgi:hypothetical protein
MAKSDGPRQNLASIRFRATPSRLATATGARIPTVAWTLGSLANENGLTIG